MHSINFALPYLSYFLCIAIAHYIALPFMYTNYIPCKVLGVFGVKLPWRELPSPVPLTGWFFGELDRLLSEFFMECFNCASNLAILVARPSHWLELSCFEDEAKACSTSVSDPISLIRTCKGQKEMHSNPRVKVFWKWRSNATLGPVFIVISKYLFEKNCWKVCPCFGQNSYDF